MLSKVELQDRRKSAETMWSNTNAHSRSYMLFSDLHPFGTVVVEAPRDPLAPLLRWYSLIEYDGQIMDVVGSSTSEVKVYLLFDGPRYDNF